MRTVWNLTWRIVTLSSLLVLCAAKGPSPGCPCQSAVSETSSYPIIDPAGPMVRGEHLGGYGMGVAPPGPAPLEPAPPPGTLGRTYLQRSALIPDDKHPRVGMVHVYLPEHVKVSARGMNATWTGKVWQLETIGALVPHLPHIYPIEATFVRDGCEVKEVRWVRLIMGRVVDLCWQ